ncbi:MAG: glycosyl hydrolase, partial [Bifidobacterium breve]|nr:glycosyl hydrolase [Bifidobacterium breve]
MSMLRNPMGASDYARDVYSYDDMPDGKRDDSMEHFSIARDERNVIPLIHEAKRLNPDLEVVMSPWSAPAWMKTNGSMKAGSLREDCRETYARYFVQCLRAYRSHGIEV